MVFPLVTIYTAVLIAMAPPMIGRRVNLNALEFENAVLYSAKFFAGFLAQLKIILI